jgi:PAS domain S-box-containing protein
MQTPLFSPSNYSFTLHAVPPIVTAFAIFLLGVIIAVREKGSRVSLLYLLYALTVGAWLLPFSMTWLVASEQLALWWAKAAHVGVTMIPATLYHFTVVVLGTGHRRRKLVRVAWGFSAFFLATALLTDALFDSFYHYPWGIFPKYRWYALPFLLYFLVMTIIILRMYWVEYRAAESRTTRQRRAKAFLAAFSIGYLGALDFLPAFGVPYYPVGSLPMFGLVILVAHAIWKYRLVDITPAFAAHQIIDTMNDALIVLDPEGVVRLVNQATCSLFGCGESELVGRRLADALAGSREFAEQLEAIAGSGAVRSREVAYLLPWNGRMTLSVSASIMRSRDGEPQAVVCVLSDVSERKRAEEDRERLITELQRANEKLKAVDNMKTEFVSVVAHELRTPLTTIKAFIELIMMKPDMAEQKRSTFMTTINAEADRLTRLIADLLDLARIESGSSMKLRHDPLCLEDVVRDAVTSMTPLFESKELRVTTEFQAPLASVTGDRDRLMQVVINLLSNAAKFTPAKGALHVAVRREPTPDGRLAVEISDTGIGIADENVGLIFEKFQRSGDRTAGAIEGTGLGLAISKQIIEHHGGSIRAASVRGAGSTFTFTLPRAGER